jgi:hypothetical protein
MPAFRDHASKERDQPELLLEDILGSGRPHSAAGALSGPPDPQDAVAVAPVKPTRDTRGPSIQAAGGVPDVQRQGGVEVGPQSIQTSFTYNPEKKISNKYATVTFGAPVNVQAQLKSKAAPSGGGLSGEKKEGGGAVKTSLTVYEPTAKAAGKSKFGQLAHDDIDKNGYKIKTVDWIGELGAEEEEGSGKVSIATGIKVTYENGDESVVQATLFEKAASTGLSGPSLTVNHKFELANEKLWENEDAELTVSGAITFVGKVEPKWSGILAELAEKGGRHVARQFGRAALRGMVNFFLGAGGFVVGGVLVVATALANAEISQAVKKTITAAKNAVESYVSGYCSSWGIQEYGEGAGGKWSKQGVTDGNSRMSAMVSEIQKHPVFAQWKFTDEELRGAMKPRLQARAADVYNQVTGEVKQKIYTEFVIQFYHQRKGFWTPNYIARNAAKTVARSLNVDESVIPKE